MDITSGGNPIQATVVVLVSSKQTSDLGLTMLGYNPFLKPPLWSRESAVHCAHTWVTLELGPGRQGQPHLKHMFKATGRGHPLELN